MELVLANPDFAGSSPAGWARLSEIAMPGTANSQGTARPIVVPANVDEDGSVLKYGAGSHELVFTEPLNIAAMAAPPCQSGIEQNLAACVTRFGQGTSSTVDASLTVTVKASVTAGIDASVNVPFVGDVGVEMRTTVTATASAWAGAAYTVEKTVTYTSGSLEDAVVFTSIPNAIYRYDIVSHPDPTLVGMQVVVRVPREPVTMIAERTFFNDALPDGATPIAGNVFDHTPGEVGSYPSTSRKDALRSQYGGIEFGPSGVGQGGGDTELEISVSTEIGAGGSLGIEYEKTVEATAGVGIAGFSVGYGAEAALSITSGSQTSYTGIVGSIATADFAANAYPWGSSRTFRTSAASSSRSSTTGCRDLTRTASRSVGAAADRDAVGGGSPLRRAGRGSRRPVDHSGAVTRICSRCGPGTSSSSPAGYPL